MDSTFSNPSKVIQVIKALADPTRLGMLLNMNSNSPKGVTASQLADKLGKKIPTILHHLEKLEELGLAEFHMTENEAGRSIKHWRVVNTNFLLDINLNAFSDAKDEIDELIIYLFEEEKRRADEKKKDQEAGNRDPDDQNKDGYIDFDYTDYNDPQMICDKIGIYLDEVNPGSETSISLNQANEIHSRLRKKGELEKYLRKWIFKEFKESAASLQLDFFELGEKFALGSELRRRMWEHFLRSNKFSSIVYSEEGRPIQRLKLRPEYLDDPDI